MTHIVIADPDPSIRNLLKQVAGLLGWTCDLAASGGEAWQLIKKTQPDLVIAEVEMSKMSGSELVGTTKYHSFLFHIPVIVISSPHQKIDALAAGCAAFVAKPSGLYRKASPAIALSSPREAYQECVQGRHLGLPPLRD
jgi:CheY-like chemotaxis protein